MTDASEFKLVLAPPTDTDPPTAPIATWDNMIGINPPYALVKDTATPYDYGAVGDGVTDDTVAMQAWLDAIAGTVGFLQTGTYMISDKLIIRNNTTIWGAGVGSATITISSDFPAATQMLTNEHIVAVGIKQDSNISLYNFCIQGSSTTEVSVEMVGLCGVQGINLIGMRFQHWRRFLTTYQNTDNVVIDRCEFYDWGSLIPVEFPGQCLYSGGEAMWMGAYDTNFRVTNCIFYDGQATAILLGLEDVVTNNQVVIDGNIFIRCVEAFIFGGANSLTITNNKFFSVTLLDCSGTGLELGGLFEATIANNQFYDIANSAIFLFNSRLVNITGNTFSYCNRTVSGGQLTLYSHTVGSGPGEFAYGMASILISDNTFNNNGFTSVCGINMTGGGGVMTAIDIHGNNFAPESQWTETPIKWDDATIRGTGFMVRDNNGGSPKDISSMAVQFVIPSGQEIPFTVAGVGFKPATIDLLAAVPSATALGASIGRQGWGFTWDVASATQSTGRTYMTANGISMAANGTVGISGPINECSIFVQEPDETPICIACVTEVNSDGFTVSILLNLAIDAGGTGYAVGDQGTITAGDSLAQYRVLSVSAGVVTSIASIVPGAGYVNASGVATVATTGAGTGLTLDVAVGTAEQVWVIATCHA